MSNLPPGVTGAESTFWLRDPTDAEMIAATVTDEHRKWMTPYWSGLGSTGARGATPNLVAFAQSLEAEYGFTIPVEDFGNLLRREEAIEYVMERIAR